MNNTLYQRLTKRAARLNRCPADERFIEHLDNLLTTPNFYETDGWSQFVDKELQDDWAKLDRITKLAIYVTAVKIHMAEILKLPELPIAIPYHGLRAPKSNRRLA